MIEARELRIGNLVLDRNGLTAVVDEIRVNSVKLSKFKGYTFESFTYDEINPISITEMWLENIGFKNIGLSGNMFEYKDLIGNDNRFIIESDGYLFYPQINFDLCCWSEFKYVHQLQNLYFALTGSELTFNL